MSDRFKIWYEKNKEKRKVNMRGYYNKNKFMWVEYKKRKRKTKGQKEFREARAKCIWYLKRIRKLTYREIGAKLSIDPKNAFRCLQKYERKLSEKAN